ncbi:class I SAM-dependent RNA methyltransferase [Marisediminicola sp. LYQ134]|uniref:class I SAM-dependent RNA methyltransferase n=1 Tax=Marisediminicola sp. LYQ134 TaxID=3391061 RepID=UPI003982EED5
MGEMQGTRVEVEITGVAHGGVMVARHEGRVVFVSDAIPGERVVVEITDDSKKSFWRADVVEVVEASEHRRPHVWAEAAVDRPPADRAGGAEFGHIDLAFQRELKRRVLTESLERMAGVVSDVVVEALPAGSVPADASPASASAPDVDGTGWRTRVRLHVGDDGRAGPYAARSHRVIPVESLPLAVDEVRSIAPLDESFSGADFVDIVVPSTGNPFVIAGQSAPAGGRGAAGAKRQKKPRANRIVERVGDREFRLDADGFWQVHRHAAATLTSAVQSSVDEADFDPTASNLDLYGGVGLLAAALGDRFGRSVRVTSVESDERATDHAAHNLSDWVGAAAVTARVDAYLRSLTATAGAAERARLTRATVVLDPPRSGAGKGVVSDLAALGPQNIVYVACDPVALARDVALFAERGYSLTALRAFDLFPSTHHVEAVATLRRE